MGNDGPAVRWRVCVCIALAVAVALSNVACSPGRPGAGGDAELSAGTGPLAASQRPSAGRVDGTSLAVALSAAGIDLPAGSNVYAAVFDRTGPAVRLDQFEAGGGSKADDFWPASSVKLLAAVGALAFLKTLGFTGAATVVYGNGSSVPVRTLVDDAVEGSSNDAYDSLVEIAGVDWLNTTFLTAANGFPDTVIQRSYIYPDVISSPAMTLSENGREVAVPARPTEGGFGVVDRGNRSNLLELTESVRRVVLHGVLPAGERFPIEAVDALDLEQALLAAEGWIDPAVARILGRRVLLYKKPGFVPGDDCVDVAYIEDLDRPHAYLVGVSTPDDGRLCQTLVDVARGTLAFLGAF